MGNSYLLQSPAELNSLDNIRGFIEQTAGKLGLEQVVKEALELAVDEAVTNVILHGYKGRTGSIEIEVIKEGVNLVIYLRDEAAPFDPTGVPPPDLNLVITERSPGGLGLYLIRKSVDELSHRCRAGGGNELTLVKKGVCGK